MASRQMEMQKYWIFLDKSIFAIFQAQQRYKEWAMISSSYVSESERYLNRDLYKHYWEIYNGTLRPHPSRIRCKDGVALRNEPEVAILAKSRCLYSNHLISRRMTSFALSFYPISTAYIGLITHLQLQRRIVTLFCTKSNSLSKGHCRVQMTMIRTLSCQCLLLEAQDNAVSRRNQRFWLAISAI